MRAWMRSPAAYGGTDHRVRRRGRPARSHRQPRAGDRRWQFLGPAGPRHMSTWSAALPPGALAPATRGHAAPGTATVRRPARNRLWTEFPFDFGLALTPEQAQEVPEVKEMIDNPRSGSRTGGGRWEPSSRTACARAELHRVRAPERKRVTRDRRATRAALARVAGARGRRVRRQCGRCAHGRTVVVD
jgi:hypothetical protein